MLDIDRIITCLLAHRFIQYSTPNKAHEHIHQQTLRHHQFCHCCSKRVKDCCCSPIASAMHFALSALLAAAEGHSPGWFSIWALRNRVVACNSPGLACTTGCWEMHSGTLNKSEEAVADCELSCPVKGSHGLLPSSPLPCPGADRAGLMTASGSSTFACSCLSSAHLPCFAAAAGSLAQDNDV